MCGIQATFENGGVTTIKGHCVRFAASFRVFRSCFLPSLEPRSKLPFWRKNHLPLSSATADRPTARGGGVPSFVRSSTFFPSLTRRQNCKLCCGGGGGGRILHIRALASLSFLLLISLHLHSKICDQRNLIHRRETFYDCTVGPLSNKQPAQLLKLRANGACLP